MNSSKKELIAPSLVLVIMCFVITASLAGTYQMTKPIIEDINAKNADATRAVVMPAGADGFTKFEGELAPNVVDMYKANNGSGMTFTTVDKGFGGTITVMVGVDANGAITGVKITDHTETPGLGNKAMTPEYLSQYIGQTAITRTDEAEKTQIDAITGATVSSNAIFRATNTALIQYEKIGGVQQ